MTSIFDSREFNGRLFFPRWDDGEPPEGVEEIFLEGEGARLHLRRYLSPQARFSLLYFHGNGEIVADHDSLAHAYSRLGAELMVLDYRGYGRSSGTPTLRAVMEDSRWVYRHLCDAGKLMVRRAVMGRSLGSAPAIELCSSLPGEMGACIIESGFCDPLRLAKRRGLSVDGLQPQEDAPFNNGCKIALVTCPLLVIHGAEDMLIEPWEAQENFSRAGSSDKRLVLLEGVGHNDIMFAPGGAYFASLERFFADVFPV